MLSFPGAEARQRFVDELRAEDDGDAFLVAPWSEEASGSPPRYEVTVSASHAVDRVSSHIHVVALARRADKHGGRHEGWGALEVRAPSSPTK